jgi:hypothetical protein
MAPREREQIYQPDCFGGPPRDLVLIFDDVLTTGAHSKAMRRVILQTYPADQVVRLLIARCIMPPFERARGLMTRNRQARRAGIGMGS